MIRHASTGIGSVQSCTCSIKCQGKDFLTWKKVNSISFLHQICSISALEEQKLEQKSNYNLF